MARKTEKGGKFRNVHCRTWNMSRKLKIMENEKHPRDDLKNDEITAKREKWEMHTVEPGIWREKWKSRKMRNTHSRTWNMRVKLKKVDISRSSAPCFWHHGSHCVPLTECHLYLHPQPFPLNPWGLREDADTPAQLLPTYTSQHDWHNSQKKGCLVIADMWKDLWWWSINLTSDSGRRALSMGLVCSISSLLKTCMFWFALHSAVELNLW